MEVRSFLFFLLLTVTCPASLQAQPRDGDPESSDNGSRGEVGELKNITLTFLKEFLSFSASVKADLTAVKADMTAVKEDLTAVKLNLSSLWSELGRVSNTMVDMKQDFVTTKRKIQAQDVILDGFQKHLDSIQQAVETDILGQGERLFNQTSALVHQLAGQQLDSLQVVERDIGEQLFNQTSVVSALVSQLAGQQLENQVVERGMSDQAELLFNQTSALVSQLADQQLKNFQEVERGMSDQAEWLFNQTSALVSQLAYQQEVLYHNLSNEVSSVCSVVRDNPPTQDYSTEPPASNEPPTSTTVSPTSTIGLLTGTTTSLTSTIASPTPTTVSPTGTTEPVTSATECPTEEGYSCGGTSGWRRVAFLNMTDPTHQCPSGWQLTGYSKRTCGRASAARYTCDSATFPTGEHYSRVCGRVVAYQFGTTPAFYSSSMNIESRYVTGLSITHGSPRQHIWTLAGGLAESRRSYIGERCPCDGGTSPVPDFVGSDYYCESGINGPWVSRFVFHPEDRLWDGEDCVPGSSCCEGTLLPYFVKELGGSTTDDIETRICSYYSHSISDIAIELVEFYVQ